MNLPPGKSLRIEMTGLPEGEVRLSVQGVVRAGGVERVRELTRGDYPDAIAAMRAARDWCSTRITADAETHAPAAPPVLDVPAEINADSGSDSPF